MAEPKRILFVCMGNIVRSPLAENLFLHLAQQAGLDGKYAVDSAGTTAYHVGEAPDRRMRRVAEAHGLKYTGRSRQVHASDFDEFDLILAMDTDNYTDLLAKARTPEQRAKVRLMRAFDPQAAPQSSVPDPYYGGIEGFEETYRIVERACQGLLDTLESGALEV